MGTLTYAIRHKSLGLCRNCPQPIINGSAIFCKYHQDKDRIQGRKKSKLAILKLKNECLDHYGRECVCCGEKIVQFLTIDHEAGNGNIHRKELFGYNISGLHMYRWLKKNKFPLGFRILCMNCNWATRYNSECPHKLER
jgi:hypothetical protein